MLEAAIHKTKAAPECLTIDHLRGALMLAPF
jgi:hypothetical protein